MTVTPCEDCARAACEEWHGFTNPCVGCRARAASRSPAARERRLTGKRPALWSELLRVYGVTDEQVKAAAAADKLPAPRQRAQNAAL